VSGLPPVIGRDDAEARLAAFFPRDAFQSALSSKIAAAGVVAMLYVGSVVEEDDVLGRTSPVVRPSTCLWLQDEVLEQRSTAADREAWFGASSQKRKLEKLVTSWGITFRPWYGDNTRETLRDEALRGLADVGAVRDRRDLSTTSSSPRWALARPFAALFDPELTGDELHAAIEAWRDRHLNKGELVRLRELRRRQGENYAVKVALPNGEIRTLEAGAASQILRGIVEEWAPRRLKDPVVLIISEPGSKMPHVDKAMLDALGVTIDVGSLLPDAIIADILAEPVEFWIVEAVNTDGPITERRKADLQMWAARQGIDPLSLRYLTAFLSRGDAAARKRLRDLASGTFAWFLDEPDHELAWAEIPPWSDHLVPFKKA
jgi:hypothetical protein